MLKVYTYGREKVGLKALAISLAAVNAANQTTARYCMYCRGADNP